MTTIKGTTDYGNDGDTEHNYRQGNTCAVCPARITDGARYCRPHKALLQTSGIQGQIARLIELAREREAGG